MSVIINNSRLNAARINGASFDGMTDPVTKVRHFPYSISEEEKFTGLAALGSHYMQLYGAAGPGKLSRDGSFVPNRLMEIRSALEAASSLLPKEDNRVLFFGKFFGAGGSNVGKSPLPRFIILPEADRDKIPRQYWSSFYFMFVDRLDGIPPALARLVETRVDGILNTAAANARLIARKRGSTPKEVFEEMMHNAIVDSELELEPLLSAAPSDEHALLLKCYAHLALAAPNLNPDVLVDTINGLAKGFPLDYYTDVSMASFRTLKAGGREGFQQLLYEAAIIASGHALKEKEEDTFQGMQRRVEGVQFLEDIAILISRFQSVMSTMFSEFS